ncbi:hypothetical protein PPMP20_21900 [Paraburkholderia phymatum]|uniref:Uncharacterized protein n=1 Tax=Paraburkholderia phymatum (strain DSM 17167 / CIP 108236 / LMG 21445 / STM815) TaxID=391038 RepID=B2JMZ1_PARP8|nr:hypothetical protein [Paraburkholderia phymatum]ACC74384.1 hypothetical protein Bphy_5306 [Paraburkholderia phymatum STM815]
MHSPLSEKTRHAPELDTRRDLRHLRVLIERGVAEQTRLQAARVHVEPEARSGSALRGDVARIEYLGGNRQLGEYPYWQIRSDNG